MGFFSWGHRTCQNQRRGKGIEGIFPLPDQVLWHELSFEKRKDGTFHFEFKASKDEIREAQGFLESDGTFEMTLNHCHFDFKKCRYYILLFLIPLLSIAEAFFFMDIFY